MNERKSFTDGREMDLGDSPQPGPSGVELDGSPRPGPGGVQVNDSPQPEPSDDDDEGLPVLREIDRAYSRCYIRYRYSIPRQMRSGPQGFLSNYRNYFINEIQRYFHSLSENFPPSVKIFSQIPVTLTKFSISGDDDVARTVHIAFRAHLITVNEISSLVDLWIARLDSRLENLTNQVEGSGYIISKVGEFLIFFLRVCCSQWNR